MTAKRAPETWSIRQASIPAFLDVRVGYGQCVQVAFVVEDLGRAAQIDLIDSAGRVLASASGSEFLLVPLDGPLCMPDGPSLRLRVQADAVPIAGLAVQVEPL